MGNIISSSDLREGASANEIAKEDSHLKSAELYACARIATIDYSRCPVSTLSFISDGLRTPGTETTNYEKAVIADLLINGFITAEFFRPKSPFEGCGIVCCSDYDNFDENICVIVLLPGTDINMEGGSSLGNRFRSSTANRDTGREQEVTVTDAKPHDNFNCDEAVVDAMGAQITALLDRINPCTDAEGGFERRLPIFVTGHRLAGNNAVFMSYFMRDRSSSESHLRFNVSTVLMFDGSFACYGPDLATTKEANVVTPVKRVRAKDQNYQGSPGGSGSLEPANGPNGEAVINAASSRETSSADAVESSIGTTAEEATEETQKTLEKPQESPSVLEVDLVGLNLVRGYRITKTVPAKLVSCQARNYGAGMFSTCIDDCIQKSVALVDHLLSREQPVYPNASVLVVNAPELSAQYLRELTHHMSERYDGILKPHYRLLRDTLLRQAMHNHGSSPEEHLTTRSSPMSSSGTHLSPWNWHLIESLGSGGGAKVTSPRRREADAEESSSCQSSSQAIINIEDETSEERSPVAEECSSRAEQSSNLELEVPQLQPHLFQTTGTIPASIDAQ